MAAPSTQREDEEQVINVLKFLELWGDKKNYPLLTSEKSVDEAIANRMGVSMETVQELSECCSPSTLWHSNKSLDKQVMFETIPDDVQLETVKNQGEELKLRKTNSTYTSHIMRKMKYNYSDWYKYFQPDEKVKREVSAAEDSVIKEPNVVLTVEVHRPYHNKSSARMLVSETYLVLGTNKLTELRDVIKCSNDYAVAGDLSLTPEMKDFTFAKDSFKSGFFFIEGTFYNDMRLPDNRDYSQTIRNWISQEKRSERIGPFGTAKMEDTTFLDLDIIVGKPYFYQHQGDCEHLIMFSDLRIFHPMDPQKKWSYPFLVREVNHRRKICKVCMMNTSRWIVYKCPLIPTNPAFMCHRCFKALLFDENGQKIGEFEAYRSAEHPT